MKLKLATIFAPTLWRQEHQQKLSKICSLVARLFMSINIIIIISVWISALNSMAQLSGFFFHPQISTHVGHSGPSSQHDYTKSWMMMAIFSPWCLVLLVTTTPTMAHTSHFAHTSQQNFWPLNSIFFPLSFVVEQLSLGGSKGNGAHHPILIILLRMIYVTPAACNHKSSVWMVIASGAATKRRGRGRRGAESLSGCSQIDNAVAGQRAAEPSEKSNLVV